MLSIPCHGDSLSHFHLAVTHLFDQVLFLLELLSYLLQPFTEHVLALGDLLVRWPEVEVADVEAVFHVQLLLFAP